MKLVCLLIFPVIIFQSCLQPENKSEETIEISTDESYYENHPIYKEMEEVGKELEKFDFIFEKLYIEAADNPQPVINKIDSLLVAYKNMATNNVKRQAQSYAFEHLYYLQAELYYQLGNYYHSIKALKYDDYYGTSIGAALAANYVKLERYDSAKIYIDEIGKGYYIYDYTLANYYECINEKSKAIEIYTSIQKDKHIKHYTHYGWAVDRLQKLKNNKPLLKEIHFPTKNPNFEIAKTDNNIRRKIFDMIGDLPEVQNCKNCATTSIYESPQINDKDYYWVKVGDRGDFMEQKEFKTKYNFFFYAETLEIKFYNENNNQVLTLEEWRNQ